MRSHHDMGGLPAGPGERREPAHAPWEKRGHAPMVPPPAPPPLPPPGPAAPAALRGAVPPARDLAGLSRPGAGHRRERDLSALAGARAMTADSRRHAHDHDHDHHHPTRADDDDRLSHWQTMEIALRELLVAKGIITADEVRGAVEAMYARDPAQGARVVARAWTDPAYKARLLADGTAPGRELGIGMAP